MGGWYGEITDQREEGRGKGSVNSAVGRFFSSTPQDGTLREALISEYLTASDLTRLSFS